MSETKFTKGEWRVEQFVSRNGFEIAFNDDGEVVAEYVYEEYDALLIAAAPEMYELIEMLLKCEHKRGGSLGADGSFYYKVSEEVFKKAEKLLAKARGEK